MTSVSAPRNDFEREHFLSHFASNLPAFSAALGLGQEEVAAVLRDAAVFQWAMDTHEQYRSFTRDWMVFKKRLRDGVDGSDEALFSLPQRPSAPIKPQGDAIPGVFRRVGRLIERIKSLPGYTLAIGEILGIEEAEWIIDAAWAKPYIKVRRFPGGFPEVVWSKYQYDGLLLEVDRDGRGFSFLAVHTVPNFIDTHPLPPPGSKATWKYRAIYHVGDEPSGQWSEVALLSFPGAA